MPSFSLKSALLTLAVTLLAGFSPVRALADTSQNVGTAPAYFFYAGNSTGTATIANGTTNLNALTALLQADQGAMNTYLGIYASSIFTCANGGVLYGVNTPSAGGVVLPGQPLKQTRFSTVAGISSIGGDINIAVPVTISGCVYTYTGQVLHVGGWYSGVTAGTAAPSQNLLVIKALCNPGSYGTIITATNGVNSTFRCTRDGSALQATEATNQQGAPLEPDCPVCPGLSTPAVRSESPLDMLQTSAFSGAGLSPDQLTNVATGNLLYKTSDYAGESGNLLNFGLIYNSTPNPGVLSVDTPLLDIVTGRGWRNSYSYQVVYSGTGAGYVILSRPDGSSRRFTCPSQSGVCAGEAKETGKLTFVVGSGSSSPAQFTYVDALGNKESYSDIYIMSYQFSKGGKLTFSPRWGQETVTDDRGRTLTIKSTSTGTQVTLPDGKVITYAVDGYGRLSSIVYPDGAAKTFTYAAPVVNGVANPLSYQLHSVVDERGVQVLGVQYDAGGLVTQTSGAGGTSQYQFSNIGGTASVTTPTGAQISTVSANPTGRPQLQALAVTCPNASCAAGSASQSYTYDASGNLTAAVDSLGLLSCMTYNSRNLLTKKIEGLV